MLAAPLIILMMKDDPTDFTSTAWPPSNWPRPEHSLRAPANSIHVQTIPGWWPAYVGRRRGFSRAAAVLGQAMLDAHPSDRDTLVFPWLNCWRHYVELELKYLHGQYAAVLGKDARPRGGHNIKQLWSELKPFLKEFNPQDSDNELANVGNRIEELWILDPNNEHARYAYSRDGSPSLSNVDSLNVVEFHTAMAGLAAFFDAADTAVGVQQDFDAEMAQEYSQYNDGY